MKVNSLGHFEDTEGRGSQDDLGAIALWLLRSVRFFCIRKFDFSLSVIVGIISSVEKRHVGEGLFLCTPLFRSALTP